MIPRRAISRSCEVGIAESAATATRRQPALAVLRKVVQQVAGAHFENLRTDGHAHDYVFALVTGSIATFAMQSTAGGVLRVVAEMQQGVQRFIGFDKNISTTPAISTRWTTTRHKLFAAECS